MQHSIFIDAFFFPLKRLYIANRKLDKIPMKFNLQDNSVNILFCYLSFYLLKNKIKQDWSYQKFCIAYQCILGLNLF